MKLNILLVCLIALGPCLHAQQGDVYISRYLPGGPDIQDAEVSIFNADDEPANLSGYVLASRYWVLKLPAGTVIPGLSSLTFSSDPDHGTLYLRGFPLFSESPDESQEQGDYIALFDHPGGYMIDGLYLSDQIEVNFLPGTQVLSNGTLVEVPGEAHSRWSLLRIVPDPIMAFDRNEGVWGANARTGNLFPATRYLYFQGRSIREGVVSLKWKTEFETNCLFHRIERSPDSLNFEEIGRLSGLSNSNELTDYQFLDSTYQQGQPYYYRIHHIDRAGKSIYSEIIRVSNSAHSGFQFYVLKEGPEDVQYLRIRYSSQTQQEVKLKLLDGRLRQIEVLNTGTIEPNREYLVTYRKTLAQGVYYLLVETDDGRYHEVVVIQ